MSSKVKYGLPADDEDEEAVEDGDEIVDMQESPDNDAGEHYDSDPDQNQDFDPEDVQVPDEEMDLDGQMEEEDLEQSENKRPNGQRDGNPYALENAFAGKPPSGMPVMNGRLRPQSAKTAPTNEQFRFH